MFRLGPRREDLPIRRPHFRCPHFRRRLFHPRRSRAAIVLRLMLGASCLAVPAVWLLAPDRPARAQETPYAVDLADVEDEELRDLIEASSTLIQLADDPPPSPIGLGRRAETDRQRIQAALRSVGFYSGEVDIDLETDTGGEPAQVSIGVRPGPRYTFDRLRVTDPDGGEVEGLEVDRSALGLDAGAAARAAAVVSAEPQLVSQLVGRGYAFARVTGRDVVVDHADRTMDVTYMVERGPLVRFGETRIEGLEQVDPGLVRNRLAWQPGQRYDPDLLEETRGRIVDIGPFASVSVQLAPEPGPDGVTPVVVTAAERPRRIIGAGLSFSTTDGFGAEAYWGHRNLFGGAEQLRISGFVANVGTDSFSSDVLDETDFGAALEFRKPDFLSVDQTLFADLELIAERPEAYDREAVVASFRLSRELSDALTVGYGVTVERSRVTEAERTVTSMLFGLPLLLAWDGTDDLLDPTGGVRTELLTTPWMQAGGADARFLATRWTTSAYRSLMGDGRLVLAGRLALGSIVGAEVEEIPADKRFYAGGGGSIRGYGYQEVGPRDAFGDPRGGRSLFEVGAELRWRVTDTIGIVPFVDGGMVFDTALPNFDEEIKWGAGLGLRYYTGFGPLRADVAVPLNREDEDDAWALYLSIGQAF